MNEELNRVRGRVSYLIESCENGFVRIPRSLLIELRDALADGGKGEAVYQVRPQGQLKWQDVEAISLSMYSDAEKYATRTLYTAPQAECAPRESQPVADMKISVVTEDKAPLEVKSIHYFASEIIVRVAARTPERADAEKDAALLDVLKRAIGTLDLHGHEADARRFGAEARAILAAKEKK